MPRQINADLISDLYLSKHYQQLSAIVNQVREEALATQNETMQHRLFAILHTLARNHKDAGSISLAKNLYETTDGIGIYDIENWTIIPGFAGHFDAFEEANSHGCGHYTVSNKQKPVLDPSDINKPLQIHELNTRYQRLHYAASLAIGKKKSIKVIDLGGGSGTYYILLRRLFPEVHFDYTCIDFDESRPLNAEEIDKDFHHVPTIQQCKEPNQCDLFVASGVLQYIQDDAFNEIRSAISSSRITLIDRTPSMKRDSFWTIQTRVNSRHAFRVFNETELSNIATTNSNRITLAEGICPEDWLQVFNMEDFNFETATPFKWYTTCKAIGDHSSRDNIDFKDFILK